MVPAIPGVRERRHVRVLAFSAHMICVPASSFGQSHSPLSTVPPQLTYFRARYALKYHVLSKGIQYMAASTSSVLRVLKASTWKLERRISSTLGYPTKCVCGNSYGVRANCSQRCSTQTK